METYRGNQEELHKAIDDFKDGQSLTKSQKNLLLKILKLSEDVIYASKETLEHQSNILNILEKLNYEDDPEKYERIISKCSEFESKYC